MVRASALVVFSLIIVAGNSFGQGRFPAAPVVPTNQDCENLTNAYLSLYRDAENETSSCMQGPPNIGQGGLIGNYATCSSYAGARSYPQCFGAELATCQLGKRMLDEQQACYARVPHTTGNQGVDSATSAYSNLNSAVSLYNNTMSFLTDPKQFMYNSLMSYSASFAKQMFNSSGQVRPQYYSTANKIYAFAQNFAAHGMQLGMTGLPRAIALQSLEQIGNHFQAALADLARATAMMDSIYISQNSQTPPSTNYSNSYNGGSSNDSNSYNRGNTTQPSSQHETWVPEPCTSPDGQCFTR